MEEEKKDVRVYREGDVGVIHLDAPPLNLINRKFKEDLDEAVAWAEKEAGLRVVIIRNSGKYFGAGGDVNEMKEKDYHVDKLDGIIQRIGALPMPTIAAMDGGAFGGSFEIALACDMRIAARGSILGLTEVNFGSFPGVGGTPRIIQLMGRAKAMEVMLLAYRWPAEEWMRYGVINAVPDLESAYDMALRWANLICQKPASGPRAVKEAVSCFAEPACREFLPHQHRIMEALAGKSDIMESSKAFLNKH